jgi:hypothetical protein
MGAPMYMEPIDSLYDVGAKIFLKAGGGDVIGTPMHTEPVGSIVGAKKVLKAGGGDVIGTPMHTEPVGSIVGAKKVS